jgi:polyvinyl alcohol dehydrogenase (cytochrome)
MHRPLLIALTVFAALPGLVRAQTPPDGAAVFEKACASCHAQPAPGSRAPTREVLGQGAPEAILTALTTGNMFRQGSELTDAERRAVAGFIAGRALGTAPPLSASGRCTSKPATVSAAAIDSGWNGWGGTVTNTRFMSADKGGLTAPAVQRLKLKWAFGFAGVNSARAQPAVVGGRLFVGSENGGVFALDAKTGCTHWMYQAQHSIRAAISAGPYKNGNTSGTAIYFADGGAVAYAVDSVSGREIWKYKVDDHPYATSTGSVTVYNGRVYVTTSGVGEEGQGGRAGYECCTFRGSVTALDASTGKPIWKSYTIPEAPKPRAKNKQGLQTWGPAGGGVWSAPTIDAARRAIYITTGNGYAEPQQPTTDAVLALDMESGKIRWSFQPLTNDVWAGGCGQQNTADNPNCPSKLGPDHDFSISPVLTKRSNGQDIIIVQQKSGMAYGIDPDKQGALVWQYRTSGGGALGGQWGAAVDDRNAYFGVNGTTSKTPGGLRAVKIDTGEEVWSKPPAETLCTGARGCSAAQGAAVTAIPGVVFSVSMDGGVRAQASDDGTIVWTFDTNKDFETVNGVKAKGGAIDQAGVVVEDGMVYVSSGYVSLIGRPGNVLLAFGVD